MFVESKLAGADHGAGMRLSVGAPRGTGDRLDGLISCISYHAGCKTYSCVKPEQCESEGGENLGQPKHHSGALAWSRGVL